MAGRVRGKMGTAISHDRADVAPGVGLCDAAVRFPGGDPEDDLYDQRGGEPEPILRKVIKTRGSFPTDDAALKLLYLAIRNAGLRWRRPIEWTAAMSQFAILFGDRFVLSAR